MNYVMAFNKEKESEMQGNVWAEIIASYVRKHFAPKKRVGYDIEQHY